jgi:AmmeMemoRadiSam system protein A
MEAVLNKEEQGLCLKIARQALESAINHRSLPEIDLETLPLPLQEEMASFVTLTIEGRLRGCIGTLQAYQPLANDVQEHAVAAGLQDFRFPNVQPDELDLIEIEVSVLSPQQPLDYDNPEDLVRKLRPDVDGVVLQDGFQKATFLPQVWEKLPDPDQFLSQLCMKMGAPPDLWRKKSLKVFTYQVQEFHE